MPFIWFAMNPLLLSFARRPALALPLPVSHLTVLAALLCSLGTSTTLHAENLSASGPDSSDSGPVIVTGSRFPNAPELSPNGAVIITAADIRDAGIGNVNEAVRKLAGIYGRQNAYGTADFDLDPNGFGADSANNLVILVDGVRLSENEQSVALLSTIPIESVARIEIMHSGSSVLYGDGATGGVIQIITKQMGMTPLTGSIYTELGQFKDQVVRATMAMGTENMNATLNLSEQRADNYRANNAVVQQNASGGLTWYTGQGRFGLRLDLARQNSEFPSALTLAQFNQNPRQASTPFAYGSIDTGRISGFVEQNFGAWQFAAELTSRNQTAQFNNPSASNPYRYDGRLSQLTPRLRNLTQFDGLTNELVFGLDLGYWSRQTNSSYSLDEATQKSKAVYFRDEVKFGQLRLAAGARHEVFDKTSADPAPGAADIYQVVQGVNAWELESSYAFVPMLTGFAKLGQSYRVANVDDNAYTMNPDTPLLPQLSHDLELGLTVGDATRQLTARLFRHDLSNEIYYDPTANGGFGANANLDPTRRAGVALEGKLALSQQWRLSAQAQHVKASFTAGVNDGNELTLVPKNIVSAHLNWLPGDGQNAYIGTQWVDRQRYGADFGNNCPAQIASHVTLDARYAKTLGAWELAVAGTNLTDKHFFTNAYGCLSGIYPDDGRQMKVSLRYSF